MAGERVVQPRVDDYAIALLLDVDLGVATRAIASGFYRVNPDLIYVGPTNPHLTGYRREGEFGRTTHLIGLLAHVIRHRFHSVYSFLTLRCGRTQPRPRLRPSRRGPA